MASPWPNQPCPHPHCQRHITDLLAEMVPNEEHVTVAFQAVVAQRPGGAITCPFCGEAVEYDVDGQTLVVSSTVPLRYSRAKMELRAANYGIQKVPPDPTMTPEQWIGEEKLMPGALNGYEYAEDKP
jgi:hypothetical protein